MKGLAIIGIVLYHYFNFFISSEYSWVLKIGGEGVHIFIILSAFGLTLSIASKKDVFILSKWYKKHFIRILFPYYCSIAIILVSILIVGLIKNDLLGLIQAAGVNKGSLMASIFLYRGFVDKYVMCINSAWWFVITILELYLVYPLLLKFYRSVGWKIFLASNLLLTIVFQLFYSVIISRDSLVFSRFFLSFLFEFSLGIFLADLFIKKIEFFDYFIGREPFIFGILCEVAGAVLFFRFRFGAAFNDTINAAGYFLVIINVVNFIFNFEKFKIILINFGKLSMPIFLLHATYLTLFLRAYKSSGLLNAIIFLPFYAFLLMFLVIGFDKYVLARASFTKNRNDFIAHGE